MASPLLQARVVGHHRFKDSLASQLHRGRKVDRVERRDLIGEDRLGRVQHGLGDRHKGHGAQQPVGVVKKVVAKGKAAKLDTKQPAGDVLIEARESVEHR